MAKTVLHVQQGARRKVSGATAAAAIPSKPAETEYDRLSEVEVWLRLRRLLEVAKQKQGEAHNTPHFSNTHISVCLETTLSAVHRLQQLFLPLVVVCAG